MRKVARWCSCFGKPEVNKMVEDFKHHAKTKEPNYSFYYEHESRLAELKITAGQRTMSGLIADLTGQTPVLPVIFGYKHFIFSYSCRLMLYNAVVMSFFFGVFCCFPVNPCKKKNTAIN